MNKLYFGDNLTVLRDHVKDESVDLIYLDPPFNSQAAYNVLYKSPVGGDAQLRVFEDTWTWDTSAALALNEISQHDSTVFNLLRALQSFLGQSDVMAYLAMMAVRLIEMRRVLKPTGSLYLHCDPTASHYLKILLDGVFGADKFQNELIWKRSSAHTAKRYAPVHDTILFYAKGNTHTWNKAFQPIPQETADAWYNNIEPVTGRRYNRADLTAAGVRTGPSGQVWRGIDVTAKGRHWAIPGFVKLTSTNTVDALNELDEVGRLHWPKTAGGMPMLKRYIEESPGIPALDLITDIAPLNNVAKERIGYPTQKPLALLERLFAASSNPGDVVLDPFCGCGTAIHAAERLGRRWIGMDVAYPAIQVIEDRIKKWLPGAKYEVAGIPYDEQSARGLAERDPHIFQQWAVGCLGGQSRGKGADRGIDGQINFAVGQNDYRRALVSVKGGRNVAPEMVRALKGVVQREGADMGVFVCLDPPSKDMRTEAATSEIIELPTGPRPMIQIVTVADLIAGADIGIRARLDAITSAEAARSLARKKPPKRREPEQLRREPELGPMAITGGREKLQQAELSISEPLLTQPKSSGRARRRGS